MTARLSGPVTKAEVSGHRASPYTVTFTSSALLEHTTANRNTATPFITSVSIPVRNTKVKCSEREMAENSTYYSIHKHIDY
jgi:hypothetical protein